MLRVSAPESIDHPRPNIVTNIMNPNSPNIIDGIPARLSVANLIIFTIFPGLAYSTKYIAAQIPIGVAINIVSNTM